MAVLNRRADGLTWLPAFAPERFYETHSPHGPGTENTGNHCGHPRGRASTQTRPGHSGRGRRPTHFPGDAIPCDGSDRPRRMGHRTAIEPPTTARNELCRFPAACPERAPAVGPWCWLKGAVWNNFVETVSAVVEATSLLSHFPVWRFFEKLAYCLRTCPQTLRRRSKPRAWRLRPEVL